jgi:hypothetical protein
MSYSMIQKLANNIDNKLTSRFDDAIDWEKLNHKYYVAFDEVFEGLNEAAFYLYDKQKEIGLDAGEVRKEVATKLEVSLDGINNLIMFLAEMKSNPLLSNLHDKINSRIRRLKVLAEVVKLVQTFKNGIKHNLQLISRTFEELNKMTSILDMRNST